MSEARGILVVVVAVLPSGARMHDQGDSRRDQSPPDEKDAAVLVQEWGAELEPGARHVRGRPGDDQSRTGHQAQTTTPDGHASIRSPSITAGVGAACVHRTIGGRGVAGAVLTIRA